MSRQSAHLIPPERCIPLPANIMLPASYVVTGKHVGLTTYLHAWIGYTATLSSIRGCTTSRGEGYAGKLQRVPLFTSMCCDSSIL